MYDFQTLKEAILFNTAEVLPGEIEKLDKEINFLVENANTGGEKLCHYIGFEISGQIHLGTGISPMLKIKKLQDAGVHCIIWLADYHTWLNNKLDGTIETARLVAREYFGPVMEKCLEIVGGNPEMMQVLLAENIYKNKQVNGLSFWDFDLYICKNLTLSRVLKSISVMGKKEGGDVEFGTLRYPSLQVADPYFLGCHFVHAGMDQRKCHVLMREVAFKLPVLCQIKINQKAVKPIAIHHNLLLGLENKGDGDIESSKMSKSKPDSAIWVHDSKSEIIRKLKKAYCPMYDSSKTYCENVEIQKFNPMLDWSKNMIFPGGRQINLEREQKFGGNVEYSNYLDLEKDYFDGKIHPLDLKNGIAAALSDWFLPIYNFTIENPDKLSLVINSRPKK